MDNKLSKLTKEELLERLEVASDYFRFAAEAVSRGDLQAYQEWFSDARVQVEIIRDNNLPWQEAEEVPGPDYRLGT